MTPEGQALADRLAANIKRLRRRARWTLKECAERADLQLRHLQKLEAGESNATLTTLVRLAKAFDVPTAALFRRSRRR